MLKNFTTKQIILIALLGAAVFVLDLIISTPISTAIGVPGSGYIITSTIFVAVAVIGGLILRKFGTFTLMALVYGFLASFTPVSGLPPLYTVVLSTLSGLVGDIVVLIFRYKSWSYYPATVLINTATLPLYLYILMALGLPGAEDFSKYFWMFVSVYAITAIIGTGIGMFAYNKKISKMGIVRQIAD